MFTEENKETVTRHLIDVLEQGHVELIPDYYAPDGSVPDMPTPEQWKEAVLWQHKHCPGFKVTILDMVAEGDEVAVHWQADQTYSVPDESMSTSPILVGKPVSWRNMEIYRVVNGKTVSRQAVFGMVEMLVENGINPSGRTTQNKAAVVKFIDGLNRQDPALLAEVCTPEIAKQWADSLPGMYSSMKDHHIELTEMISDGDDVAVKLSTSGYHTGELFGLPASGKWWTNRVYTFFRFLDGKICEVDPLPDVENHLKQIGGVIRPAAE